MSSPYVSRLLFSGKADQSRTLTILKFWAITGVSFVTLSCGTYTPPLNESHPSEIQVMIDQPPASLNPRSTLDATGQRINALLYSALTRIDANLIAQPDLAESWNLRDLGREVHFKIRTGLKDHQGGPISAADMSACLEQYRVGKPTSPYRNSFPHWIGTKATSKEVILILEQPDPYLFRNLSLLRYFRSPGQVTPCSENSQPKNPLIGSGPYRLKNPDPFPEKSIELTPVDPRYSPARLEVVLDDNSRVLNLLRGETDVTLDTLSLAKERWAQEHLAETYHLISRPGTRVSFLMFNLRDPVLAKAAVRKAITLGINRSRIVEHKLFQFASLAGSIIAPGLPESLQSTFDYDPKLAEEILDQAGFLKNSKGLRMTLHYKTTSVREGFETALIFREMLEPLGIHLEVQVVEPAVFLQSVRKGNYQLVGSRWIGISDGSILYRSLHSKSQDNRTGYANPKVDQLLEKAMVEMNAPRREALLRDVQRIIAQDLPYWPLWYWHEGALIKNSNTHLSKITSNHLSLTGALDPLLILR